MKTKITSYYALKIYVNMLFMHQYGFTKEPGNSAKRVLSMSL